jgi:crotonobetainyl-CoA:carnitine CoA-transferase CaiB-like acyl-CoA transferase
MTGVMSVTGEVGGPPLRCGLSIGDMVAGLYAVQAITTALYERERTGRGQVLDVSMFDCLFSFLSYYGTLPQATGKPPEPAGSMHASVVPMGAFRTQDGHIAVAAFNQRFWRGLCAAIGRPDLADDPRYASLRERQRHRDALMAELSALFATDTSQYWSERLDAHDVPNGPVLDVLSLLEHPWVDERRLLRPVPTPAGGTVRVSRQPVVYGSEPPPVAPAPPAPEVGQHTDTVLRQWLGLSEVDILALHQSGAIV